MAGTGAFAMTNDADERSATAAYIADVTGALATLARRQGLNTLGYLLDMAKLEADTVKSTDGVVQ